MIDTNTDATPDDTSLLAAIRNEETHALGRYTGSLAKERATLMEYYLGKPFGNEEEGRSQVISTDVADTIESILPSLIKIFVGGDTVGEFNPVGPEDEEAAKQETDYTNWVVTQQNNSFTTFYSWFKDALLQKNGYVKYWWDKKDNRRKEHYQGLTDDEFALLLQNPQVEPIQHQTYPDPIAKAAYAQPMVPGMGQPPQVPMLHDVVVQVTRPQGYVCIEPVPPEDILVAARTKGINVKDSPFVQHRTRKTISEIREMGYDIPEDQSDEDDQINNLEYLARHTPEESVYAFSNLTGEGAAREVLLKESFIRYDFDGDGFTELRRVLSVGALCLENEEIEEIPICCLSPVLMPHKHFGRSVAELVADIQLIKSTLLRQMMDNLYLQNSGRYAVNTEGNRVNLDDLLTSRIGGVIRVQGDPRASVMPIEHPFVAGQSMQMMEYLEGVKENRTGVTRYNQGLDAQSLNKTATGIQSIMSAAQERMLLIARCFAETGVKELFTSVHGMLRRHATQAQTVRLSNKWVTIDPRDWTERYDMTVSVGLGTGNKQEQGALLQNIFGLQMQVGPMGLATPENLFQTLSEMTKNAGFKQPEKFFTDPANTPPKPPPDPTQDPKFQIESRKLDIEQQKVDIQAQDSKVNALAKHADLEMKQQAQPPLQPDPNLAIQPQPEPPQEQPQEDGGLAQLAQVLAQGQMQTLQAIQQLTQVLASR